MSPPKPIREHSLRIDLQGLVQGVGFRPFVYRLACRHRLHGWVRNTNNGLTIRIQGKSGSVRAFLDELMRETPGPSEIHSMKKRDCAPESFDRFQILKSADASTRITRVSPDIAVCQDCLNDLKHQPHRINYPLINCTHCGPRFTIIRSLPYDRPQTTMQPFDMCENCRKEYEDIADRRFHAQPVACNRCGPHFTLFETGSGLLNSSLEHLLKRCSALLHQGAIVAIKGMGGFHLMCDATHDAAVQRLRDAKQRNGKPFAIMVRDLDTAARYACLNPVECEQLSSWRRPVVLLRQRKKPETDWSREPRLASDINPGGHTIGLMLPYMPLHHLLFDHLSTSALVMTSGNISDEPIVIDNHRARSTFRSMASAVLDYNRDVHNRTDDSVLFVVRNKPRLIRRSRGYVPEPINLDYPVEGILATGAELSHCFAVGREKEALLSQHIGDLKDPETHAFFEESVSRFYDLFRIHPVLAACDLHPDYLSTRFARSSSLPVVPVQHHHAHIAACMAEFAITRPVIGVCWDGTGLGTDGHIWGGEFLHADLSGFSRHAHFSYLPLPGGDLAAKQTWRSGVALLYRTYGREFLKLELPFVEKIRDRSDLEWILKAIDRNLNTPLSSAAGRLFDAVAALSMVCLQNTFHAEAPMKLESLADLHETCGESMQTSSWPAGSNRPADSNRSTGSIGPAGSNRPTDFNASADPKQSPAPFQPPKYESYQKEEARECEGSGFPMQKKRYPAIQQAEVYPYTTGRVIDTSPMIRSMVEDLQKGTSAALVSLKFHLTLVNIILDTVQKMKNKYGTDTVILTGGVFQNRFLLEKTEETLSREFQVFSPERIPCNDAGIALGQMAVAAQSPTYKALFKS